MSNTNTADVYRYRLKAAGWGWMEVNRTWRDQGRLRKDRVCGRAEKRGARQAERIEIAEEAAVAAFDDAFDEAMMYAALCDAGMCPSGCQSTAEASP